MSKYAVLACSHDNDTLEITTVCDTMEDAKNKLVERVETHIRRCREEYDATKLEKAGWERDLREQIDDISNSKYPLVWDRECDFSFRIVGVGQEIPLPLR